MKCNHDLATAVFLFVCIPVRLMLAYLVKHVPEKQLPTIGLLALMISVGFFSIYVFGLRKGPGMETMGCPIWWNDYRPVHGTLYLLAGIYALNKHRCAYVPLLIEVLFSIVLKIIKNN